MARGKIHSMELRWKIIDLHKAGMSACKIAKNLGISSTSAHYIINKYEKCGILGTRRRTGGLKSITPAEDRQIIMLRSLPVRVSAAKILNILNMTRSVPLGIDTVKKRVREIKEARLRGEEIPPLLKPHNEESFLENVNPDLIPGTPTPIKKNHQKTNIPTAASTPKMCNQVNNNSENHMDDDEFYLFEESLPDDEDYVPTGLPPFQLRMKFRGMRKKLKDFNDKKKKKKKRKKKKTKAPKIANTTTTATTKRKRTKRKPKDLPISNLKELKVVLKKADVQNLQNTNNNIVRNNTRPSRTNGQKIVKYEIEDSSEDDVIFVG